MTCDFSDNPLSKVNKDKMARKKKNKAGKPSTFRHSMRDQLSSFQTRKEEPPPSRKVDQEWKAWEKEMSLTTPLVDPRPSEMQWTHLQKELEKSVRALEEQKQEFQKLHQQLQQTRRAQIKTEQQLRATQQSKLELQEKHKQQLASLKQSLTTPASPPTVSTLSLQQWLTQHDVSSHEQVDFVLELLTLFPEDLLDWLQVLKSEQKEWFESHVRNVCHASQCQDAWKDQKVLLWTVEDQTHCDFCAGSDNRREFSTLLLRLRESRIYRVVVVGGSPDTHKEIEQLLPRNHQWKLVEGKTNRNKQQALQDLRSADLIILWGATILPHKVSELYTKQKEGFSHKLLTVNKRGVAGFAREVRESLERRKQ